MELTPEAPLALREEARALELQLMDLGEAFEGDPTRSRRQEPVMPGIIARVNQGRLRPLARDDGPPRPTAASTRSPPPPSRKSNDDLRQLIEADLPALEERLEVAGAPWTPRREGLPAWEPEGL